MGLPFLRDGGVKRDPMRETTKKAAYQRSAACHARRLVRDANPAPAIAADTESIPETEASVKKPPAFAEGLSYSKKSND